MANESVPAPGVDPGRRPHFVRRHQPGLSPRRQRHAIARGAFRLDRRPGGSGRLRRDHFSAPIEHDARRSEKALPLDAAGIFAGGFSAIYDMTPDAHPISATSAESTDFGAIAAGAATALPARRRWAAIWRRASRARPAMWIWRCSAGLVRPRRNRGPTATGSAADRLSSEDSISFCFLFYLSSVKDEEKEERERYAARAFGCG